MKLLFIICESSADEKVTDILRSLGAPGYTRFTGGTGFGSSGLREGTAVWPGLNTIIMAAMPGSLVDRVIDDINNLKSHRAGKLAVKVFAVPVEEC
jgi:hypothetical protein